jgi:hypothetical protein
MIDWSDLMGAGSEATRRRLSLSRLVAADVSLGCRRSRKLKKCFDGLFDGLLLSDIGGTGSIAW